MYMLTLAGSGTNGKVSPHHVFVFSCKSREGRDKDLGIKHVSGGKKPFVK